MAAAIEAEFQSLHEAADEGDTDKCLDITNNIQSICVNDMLLRDVGL